MVITERGFDRGAPATKLIESALGISAKKAEKPEGKKTESTGLMKPGQVVALLRIHHNTLRRWADEGLIEVACVVNGGVRLFDPNVVNRLIMQQDGKKASSHARPSELLTMREAAALLNVHTSTARRWAEKGILPAIRLGARRGDRRFERSEAERFKRERVMLMEKKVPKKQEGPVTLFEP